MKKVTSRHSFDFNAGNGEVLSISPEGTLASDDAAKILATRFGGIVSIEDADVEAEVNKTLAGGDVKATVAMKRTELEAMAKAKGASDEDIEAAENKDALVALINATIEAKPE